MLRRGSTTLALLALALAACDGNGEYAKVYPIEAMAQTIGGPAAGARPGDLLLENDRLRAVVHGRHNQRSTFPITNGSLIDLDIQRPQHRSGVGRGADAFYELGPMVNLKVSSSLDVRHGGCGSVGAAPCPKPGCVRVSAGGKGENIMGILGLLDLAIERKYDSKSLEIISDYDLCPGEPLVRVSTTARFYGKGTPVEMEELKGRAGLMDVLLGEHTGKACTTEADCQAGETCDKLLIELKFGSLNTEMRRCRRSTDKLSGVLAGDFILFSGKVHVFIPGSGLDHESYIRSLFDSGGDVFSAPLARPFVAGIAEDVSYAYFNETGDVMIPIFAEAFTASMTNRAACSQAEPDCLKGKELRFRRFVSVGKGDIASALEGFYRIRKIATGRVEGKLYDRRSEKPLSRADVFVFAVPKAWQALDDRALAAKSYDALVLEAQAESKTAENPNGEVGIVSHFRSDIGPDDNVPDGSFGGELPPGRYLLYARPPGRLATPLTPIQVSAGSTVRTSLAAGDTATLRFQIQDAAGVPLPSKLTIGHCLPECARDEDCQTPRPRCNTEARLCEPLAGYGSAADCRPDQSWGWDAALKKESCVCGTNGLLPLALGGGRFADNVVGVVQTASGHGEAHLEPGKVAYQVIVSRGLEYELSRHFVTLQPGVVSELKATLPRVVDTRGWVSADFHVHGPNSVDSGLDHQTRVISYAAEGVELLSASDHDYLTDYSPTIRALKLDRWLKSQIGLEVSPLDYGHFIGFPLRFDENQELNGAFHWRAAKKDPKPTEEDFRNLTPGEIFKTLRELGSLGVEKTVVFVAHFYDYFTFYSVDPWTLEMPLFGITAFFNNVLLAQNFSGDFDALEAFNGKNFDVIRRPTYQEVKDYNLKLAAFIEATKELPYDERQRRWGALSAAAQRDFLERTPSEQTLAIHYANPAFACRCAADAECGQGSLCDAATAACIPGCASDASCEAGPVAAGREKCLPKDPQGDPARKVCTRVPGSCQKDEDCTVTWPSGAKERCVALDPGRPAALTCELACSADSDCKDPLRASCDAKTKSCVATRAVAATAADPCPQLRGTIDDWFQLLNHGVRRPVLGNSDSHGTYGVEAGIPRNWVQTGGDLPQAIGSDEIAAAVKAMRSFPSYGPFVELTLNGQPMGATVSSPKGAPVTLKLRVQSPRWFDVDRIEVYRNGQLIKEVKGSTGCAQGSADCIRVPNPTVVNYDASFQDTPTEDAWYVVAVMGLDGKSLAPVYSSTPVARLGMYELIQRLTPLLPPLRSFRTPLSPSMSIVRPYAVTNPIWVDVGGDGLSALEPSPSWIPKPSAQSRQSGLTEARARPELPGHDHRLGLGRLLRDARAFEAAVRGRQLTPAMIQQALDSLRYLSR